MSLLCCRDNSLKTLLVLLVCRYPCKLIGVDLELGDLAVRGSVVAVAAVSAGSLVGGCVSGVCREVAGGVQD